jgi:hypothetical protein
MRSVRTSFGIILTLSLLALSIGTPGQASDEAAPNDNEATEPVYVTWSGTIVDFLDVPGEPQQFPWGSREYHGNTATQTSEDPRISGDYTYLYLGDGPFPAEWGESSRFTALVRLENDEGAWQGPVTIVFLPDLTWVEQGWLKGEGAYEGLSFFTSYRGVAGARHVGEGVIWPGDPPPEPDAAVLEAALDR